MKLTTRYGFTLTEVIVSILVLVIIWVAAVDALIVGKYSASYAKHKVQAMYVVQQTIEQLRKLPYPPPNSNSVVHIDTRGTPDNPGDDFTGTQIVTVSDVTGSGGYYKQVLVEIRWNEILFGRNRTMREYCGTYIANEPQIN